MGCDRDRRSEMTRGMFYYLTKRPPKANNGLADVGFLTNKKWKDHIARVNSKVAELVLCINSFYNDVDETIGKPNHYTIVMGDFNAQIGKKNKPYGNGNRQMWVRIEK